MVAEHVQHSGAVDFPWCAVWASAFVKTVLGALNDAFAYGLQHGAHMHAAIAQGLELGADFFVIDFDGEGGLGGVPGYVFMLSAYNSGTG